MKLYNLTIPINDNNISKVADLIGELLELPYPVAPRYNEELQELTILCEVQHAADVERILAPYV